MKIRPVVSLLLALGGTVSLGDTFCAHAILPDRTEQKQQLQKAYQVLHPDIAPLIYDHLRQHRDTPKNGKSFEALLSAITARYTAYTKKAPLLPAASFLNAWDHIRQALQTPEGGEHQVTPDKLEWLQDQVFSFLHGRFLEISLTEEVTRRALPNGIFSEPTVLLTFVKRAAKNLKLAWGLAFTVPAKHRILADLTSWQKARITQNKQFSSTSTKCPPQKKVKHLLPHLGQSPRGTGAPDLTPKVFGADPAVLLDYKCFLTYMAPENFKSFKQDLAAMTYIKQDATLWDRLNDPENQLLNGLSPLQQQLEDSLEPWHAFLVQLAGMSSQMSG